jgi:hypothetical protein
MSSEMKLSKQAIGAIMMALQKSLMEQTDIVPVFEGFKVKLSEEGLVVINPPLLKFNEETTAQFEEAAADEADQNTASKGN